MLASLLWPVTALICRVSTLFEDRTVTVVALRELGTFSTDAENVDEVLFNRVGPGTRRSFTAGNINI